MLLAGACSLVCSDLHALKKAGIGATRENPVFDDAQSEPESTDTWPFDNMSSYTPTALQHTTTDKAMCLDTVGAEQKFNMMEISDSAWETLYQERHMHHRRDSSGSTVVCDTSFIKHVGDKLFDQVAK